MGGRCARPICGGRGCAGCAQDGGVVRMEDGAVTFKGGTISGAVAVRARVAFACRTPQMLVLDATCCPRCGMPRCGYGALSRVYVVCEPLYAAMCCMLHVA